MKDHADNMAKGLVWGESAVPALVCKHPEACHDVALPPPVHGPENVAGPHGHSFMVNEGGQVVQHRNADKVAQHKAH